MFASRQSSRGGDKVISPPPVALIEGRRRGQWCLPGTTDSLCAREAKVFHQVNQVVAQSEIRWHPVDRFYARHFDLRQGGCRRFVRPDRRRLLRMCCKRPCQSNASEQAYEFVSVHSITSSARASSVGGTSRPSALAVCRLMMNSNFVDCNKKGSATREPIVPAKTSTIYLTGRGLPRKGDCCHTRKAHRTHVPGKPAAPFTDWTPRAGAGCPRSLAHLAAR